MAKSSKTKPKPEGYEFGRPTAYKAEFCQIVIEVGKKGGWLTHMAHACDVSDNTLKNWANPDHESYQGADFLRAFETAKQKSRIFWEDSAQNNLTARNYKGDIWKAIMQARFREDYTERKVLEGDKDAPLITQVIYEVVDPKEEED